MSSVQYQCNNDGRDNIAALARQAGAVAVGFAEVAPLSPRDIAIYDDWIERGNHAGMDYMARHASLRRNPELLLEGARSVMCAAFSYALPPGQRSGLFADYAVGDDYHDVLRKRLQPVAEAMQAAVPGSLTRICVDTAPLRERLWAVKAGLGFIGRNCQLIVPGVGSRVFLAEILWTAAVEPTPPCPVDRCSNCGACVRACPGQALDGCGSIDARRCLSYLTIEHRGDLPDNLSLSGRRIYGCDICQDVCPCNNVPPSAAVPEFMPRPDVMALSLASVEGLQQPDFSRIFKGSAVKRAKLAGLLRNAAKARKDN